MGKEYAQEKFHATLDILATHPGYIKDRLLDACFSQFMRVIKEDLPDPFWTTYEVICKEVTIKPAVNNEGSLTATISNMTEDEALAITRRIVDLIFEFDLHYDDID